MNDLSVVIVTYRQDLSLFERCIQSIAKYGIVAHDIKIIVVVNDDTSLIAELAEMTNPLKLNIDILHYSEITDWNGHIGWDSQQYFKLAVAQLITTTWYLILDSDSFMYQHVSIDSIIIDNQAVCSWTKCADHHRQQLYNANAIWPNEVSDYSMSDSPPFIMHTDITKKLLKAIDKNWFNFDKQGQLYTFEFFLYYSYLEHTGNLDKLYVKKSGHPLIRGIQR